MKFKLFAYLATFSFLFFNTSFVFSADDDEDADEVVVTGSYITRSNQNQSVPVDVIGADELDAQGTPSITDLILNLPSMSGTHNQQDQFQGSGVATGIKNINIFRK